MENRARSSPVDNAIREHHPELYFGNGDVVLQAQLPSIAENIKFQLYCVHKAILSFHSVIFANLFADASAAPEATYDGRPLVEMPDDADDLSHLLRFLYKPAVYLLRPSHPDTAFELRGAARLAGKYLIDAARADMIQRVTMDWPDNVHDWGAREAERRGVSDWLQHQQPYIAGRQSLASAYRTPEPVSAIVFAQEHGCPEILPAAFYSLASIPLGADYRSDTPSPSGAPPLVRWSLFDTHNLVRYFQGREALARYHHDLARRLCAGAALCEACAPLDPLEPDNGQAWEDVGAYPCLRFLWMLRSVLWGTQPTYDPLSALARLGRYKHALENVDVPPTCPDDLCVECRDTFQLWIACEREELWHSLPKYFASAKSPPFLGLLYGMRMTYRIGKT